MSQAAPGTRPVYHGIFGHVPKDHGPSGTVPASGPTLLPCGFTSESLLSSLLRAKSQELLASFLLGRLV